MLEIYVKIDIEFIIASQQHAFNNCILYTMYMCISALVDITWYEYLFY